MYEIIAKLRNNIELSTSDLSDIAYLNVHRRFVEQFFSSIVQPDDIHWIKQAIVSKDNNLAYFASLLLPNLKEEDRDYHTLFKLFKETPHVNVKMRIAFLLFAFDTIPKTVFVDVFMFLSHHIVDVVQSCIQWYQITDPRLLVNKYMALITVTEQENLKLLYNCIITAIITLQEELQ